MGCRGFWNFGYTVHRSCIGLMEDLGLGFRVYRSRIGS